MERNEDGTLGPKHIAEDTGMELRPMQEYAVLDLSEPVGKGHVDHLHAYSVDDKGERTLHPGVTSSDWSWNDLLAEGLRLQRKEKYLRENLRRCGELAMSRKTGAIQHLVKRVLGVKHFEKQR